MPIQLPLVGKVERPAPWVVGILATGVLLASSTTYFLVNRSGNKVDLSAFTELVTVKNLTTEITASGTVVPIQSVNLSPKTQGRLVQLNVEQGDRVQRGQIIARMDSTDVEAELAQARAQLAQAQAQLDQTRRGSRPEEIAQASARLAQAEAQLAETRAGTRTEEVAQARAQVAAAQARVNLTNRRVDRYQYLAEQGAESRDRLDEVQTDARTAQANLREAQRRLVLLQQGSRPEAIAQAAAAVAEARQAYEQARNGSRPEEIRQAEATVAEAQGRVQAIEARLADTIIRAPFNGIITQRFSTEGAFVSPATSASTTSSATSTSIVAIAKGLEVLAKVPEVDIPQIKSGQVAQIIADAFPDQTFRGRVRLVAPEAVVEQNVTSFQVRVEILTGQDKLRSGMNVDLEFLGQSLENALVVPTVAIATEKGQTGVYVPDSKNKPKFRSVTIGTSIEDETQVLRGLKPGERVYIDFPEKQKPQTQQ